MAHGDSAVKLLLAVNSAASLAALSLSPLSTAMASMFLKRSLAATASDATPIGASSNKVAKQFKLPKPPQAPPPAAMLTLSQNTADSITADMKEQYVDAMVISVDAVDIPTLMEKGLKYQQNLALLSKWIRCKESTGKWEHLETGQCSSNTQLQMMPGNLSTCSTILMPKMQGGT